VSVPHELGAPIGQGNGVQHGLHGGAARGGGAHDGLRQRLLQLLVRQVVPVRQGAHDIKVQPHEPIRVDAAQLGAARLDPKSAIITEGRGIPLAQDHQIALRPAELARHPHQCLQDGIGVGHGSISL